jgi:hypothetical protein
MYKTTNMPIFIRPVTEDGLKVCYGRDLGKKGGSNMRLQKLLNEKLRNLHFSPNTLRVTKLKIRWAGNVACMTRHQKRIDFSGKPK